MIESLGQHETSCKICGSEDVFVCDTENNSELAAMFDDLISVYTPEKLLPNDLPIASSRFLQDELTDNWHLFNRGYAERHNSGDD